MSKQSDPATKEDISKLESKFFGLESKFDEVMQKIDGMAGVINEVRDNQIVGNQHHRDLEERVDGLEKIHPHGSHVAM